MAENNGEAKIVTEERKEFRKAYFFLSFIPFAIIMAVQTAATTPGIILAMFDMDRRGLPMEISTMMDVFNEKYAAVCYVIYCLICMAIFIPWYCKGIVKEEPKINYRKALGIKPAVLTVSILICLYFVISGLFIVADKAFPSVMEHYNELMKISSLGTNVFITVIYGYLLGPATEELCFRGVMQGLLHKSNMSYMPVIVIQGLLFGIMHMNLVQGVYAFVLGMVLGYIRYKYKTLILSVAAHIVFNFFGTSVELFLEDAGISSVQKIIFAAAAAAIAVVLFVVVAKDKTSFVKEEADIKSAS
ncbi:MAG: CPBP family intramembrane metalloprotease [Saccharofermentans sp.]|nr:CPBP family intramembrane metalloprotease [Saccharofermentans sp.]